MGVQTSFPEVVAVGGDQGEGPASGLLWRQRSDGSWEYQMPDGSWHPHGPPASFPPSHVEPSAPGPTRYCAACGTTLLATAVVCPRCGSSVGSPRSKTTAVLLAVFLTFWTWLYTYRTNSRKFWLGLGLDVVGVFLLTFGIGWLILLGVWIWAIVDAASKSDAWYRAYGS